MAFIPCPNCADIVFQFTLGGAPISIVISAKKGGSITVTNLTNLAAAIIEGLWTLAGGANIPGNITDLSLNTLKLTDLTTAFSTTLTTPNGITHNLPFVGRNEGEALSAATSAVTTFETANRGRSYRGRAYYPISSQNLLASEKQITSAAALDQAQFWAAVMNAINNAELSTWTFGIISRHSGGAPRPSGVFTPITTIRSNLAIGTQRRRLLA